MSQISEIKSILGERSSLLEYQSEFIKDVSLHQPGPDYIEKVWQNSDRSARVLKNLGSMFGSGRLANTGYLSILPVDQGIEHTAGASFGKNPVYFDPEEIIKLAIEGGCNAVTSSYGVLASVARKYVHKIAFVMKVNHNELLTFPNQFDQTMFANVESAFEMGAAGIGATIYFGSEESKRQITEVSEAFSRAHDLGMFTILWCYLRNPGFKKNGKDFHVSSDLSSQAIHLGCSIGADIIKQKLPENNGGFQSVGFGKASKIMDDQLKEEHPIDLTKYQVLNSYAGRCALINSGGASGENDIQDAVATAVINKRAGGAGLILGRKAFQKDREEGIQILNAVQDVYLCKDIGIV